MSASLVAGTASAVAAEPAPRLLDVETTMIYTHVAKSGVTAVTSPLDLLDGLHQHEVQAAIDATRRLQGQRMLAS
jgi:hypothetical protein